MRAQIIILLFIGTFLAEAKLPNLKLKSTSGELVNVRDYQDSEIVVFDFWSVHCKPCLKAMPKLSESFNQLKVEGLQIVGVNVDGPRNISKVKPLVETLGVTYPILLDTDKNLMEILNVQVLPTIVAFNKKGKVVWFHEGFQTGDEKEIHAKLKNLLSN